jgi:hypothetical protein
MLQSSLVVVRAELIEQAVEAQVDTELFLVNLFVDQHLMLLQWELVEWVEVETVHLVVIQV